MRLLHLLLLPPLAFGALTACDKEAVHVGFRPEAGATYRYEIKVQSVTTTMLGNERPQRATDEITLESQDTVLSAGPEEVRVEVVLRRAGSPDRTFRVRFDRAAQLAGVDEIDGLPPEVLGPVALPEFLPAAATAPPDKPLTPGEKWKIEAPARLEGTGQLVKVSSSGGRKVASIKAETTRPLSGTSKVGDAMVTLSGTEKTQSTATRALADGSVHEASSVTKGTYTLSLAPGESSAAVPLNGRMEVEIRSQTKRLPDQTQAKKG